MAKYCQSLKLDSIVDQRCSHWGSKAVHFHLLPVFLLSGGWASGKGSVVCVKGETPRKDLNFLEGLISLNNYNSNRFDSLPSVGCSHVECGWGSVQPPTDGCVVSSTDDSGCSHWWLVVSCLPPLHLLEFRDLRMLSYFSNWLWSLVFQWSVGILSTLTGE